MSSGPFNGSTVLGPWLCGRARRQQRAPPQPFNGSTVLGPWLCPKPTGRRSISDAGTPSMGPRFSDRGYAKIVGVASRTVTPSMGPRFSDRGYGKALESRPPPPYDLQWV